MTEHYFFDTVFPLRVFTPHDPRSGSVLFLFPGGFGHARLRHFFLDAGECRFAGFFFTLLLRHAPTPWVAVHFCAQPPTAPSRYGTKSASSQTCRGSRILFPSFGTLQGDAIK